MEMALLPQLLCLAQLATCAPEVAPGAAEAAAGGQGGPGGQDAPPAPLPAAVQPRPCQRPAPCDPRARFRRLDAACNSLAVPSWGMSGSPFTRLLPSDYSDGVWAPRRARDGSELPNARRLRTALLEDREVDDPRHTLLLMQLGQLLAHDTALAPSMRAADGQRIKCCADDGGPLPDAALPAECLPVALPEDDAFFGPLRRRCLPVVRTQNTRSSGCTRAAAQQISTVNHILDASFVYGNNKKEGDALRTFENGTLIVQRVGHREFLPNTDAPQRQCFLPTKAEHTCYKSGDPRVNAVPQLAALQILFVRVHNGLARGLSELNPHWNDETLYQEARRILIGQYQHVVYNEFLLPLLGKEYMTLHALLPSTNSFVDLYDEHLNPATLSSFTSSAFRALHSLIQGKVQLQNSQRKTEREITLSDWMNRPSIIHESEENFDLLLLGLVSQPAQQYDRHHTEQITNFLFRGPRNFGTDLIATDIVRNRDYGLPSYTAFQKLCKVGDMKDFDDLIKIMSKEHVEKLKGMYKHLDDVDLTVGGLLESPLPGSIVGPTFQCLIGEQFIRWKMGDRFFYEFGGFTHSFTKEQVQEIKKTTFARWICDHGDKITMMQPFAFETISEKNPLTSCNSSLIPTIDLHVWKETT